jgi:uncharacterized cysteine cluster protein YcgN (CxxCxxCC family)
MVCVKVMSKTFVKFSWLCFLVACPFGYKIFQKKKLCRFFPLVERYSLEKVASACIFIDEEEKKDLGNVSNDVSMFWLPK